MSDADFARAMGLDKVFPQITPPRDPRKEEEKSNEQVCKGV